MKFSCLVSLYKKEKPAYFKVAMDSILNQTLLPTEIVLVEDGKLTDELYAIIDGYVKSNPALFKIVAFEKNRGLGLALRDGVLECSYEYIARMDTDDIADKHRFEKQFVYLAKHSDLAILGSRITEFSINSERPDTVTDLPCSYADIVKFSKTRNPFRHMTLILKKSAVLESGNYRDFLWFEDYDLWVRIMQKGYKVENLPEYLVNVRANNEMFARRGGWNYLKQDFKFQKCLYKSGFIGIVQLLFNIIVRGTMRLMHPSIKVFIYKKFLRKMVK